ncbi:alkaline phosphatase family protein [Mycolicibacter heraklionensis]|uniref:Alkaline phosphatase family protein n=1 Tax=Mycolicibacter heraklionensis TaxID=512402 RepID=A0A9X7WHB6_9MYCO|nr:alkaline phosphatase family protein [Mycolicibacter heraklionensis]QZA07862.1 alkaline phosphatase family protein [Mycolicibacter heraklionensis]
MTTIKKFLSGVAVAGLVAGMGAAVGTPAGLSATTADWLLAAEHVLLIGTDGTNLSKILEYAYNEDSGFKTAMDQGITGATSEVNHTTISGPSWSTILTGVWDDKHGVINNVFESSPYNSWPTVFNLLEYHNPNIETSVIADWDYINDIGAAGGYGADNNLFVPFQNSWADTDAEVTAQTIAQILATTTNPNIDTFMFSYQVQVDEAGHGFGGGSAEYEQAVINVGANIQAILAAVAQAKAATGDDWSIIITTDHGHQQSLGFGHGFQSPNETSQFVIFDQAGDHATDGSQNLNYSIADITPTILSLFGVPMRSDFDGVSMANDPTVLNGIVEPTDLKQALTDAIAMFGYPNIGNDLALGLRTVIATIPYLLNGVVTDIDKFLQGIVDQDIFLISGLAQFAQQVNDFVGGLIVDSTQLVAHGVAYLTGSGVIAPTDPPLPQPGSSEFTGIESLLADHSVSAPDLGDSDLSGLLDALVG